MQQAQPSQSQSESLAFRVNGVDVHVTPALIERYNVAGPRYTSYPTYPEWSSEFGAPQLEEALRESDAVGLAAGVPLSVYVHIPFCTTLCLYCGCNVVISRAQNRGTNYVDHVIRELDLWTAHLSVDKREVSQMHWGGGTPTWLSSSELKRLAQAIRDRFRFATNAEVGIEVDPRVTTDDQLEALAAVGFNRISMGVQDLNARVLEHVHRATDVADVTRVINGSRALGFESVNIDLMYGLPYQSLETFRPTIQRTIDELRPDRIALFNYAHVPHLKKHQTAIDVDAMPPAPTKLRMLAHAIDEFTKHGYRFIGLDHFAREDDAMCAAHDDRTLYRNFMGYSTHAGADMIAFGNTAISGFGRFYAQNAHDVGEYQAAIDAGRLTTQKGMRCSDEDLLRRDVITRILCHDCVVKSEIEAKWKDHLGTESFDTHFADDLERLAQSITDGLVTVEQDGDRIQVAPLGRLFIRNVAMCFDEYYHRANAHRRFSKTV